MLPLLPLLPLLSILSPMLLITAIMYNERKEEAGKDPDL